MNCTLFIYLWIQELLGSIPHKWKSLWFFFHTSDESESPCVHFISNDVSCTHTLPKSEEESAWWLHLQPSRKGPPCLLSFVWCSSIADGGGEEEVAIAYTRICGHKDEDDNKWKARVCSVCVMLCKEEESSSIWMMRDGGLLRLLKAALDFHDSHTRLPLRPPHFFWLRLLKPMCEQLTASVLLVRPAILIAMKEPAA